MSGTRLYEVYFDSADPGQWVLGHPVDASGRKLEEYMLREESLEAVGELFVPIVEPGHPLDVSVGPYPLVVTERVGRLLGALAPEDLQRLPARVESMEGRYEVVKILTTIDCLDRERTRAQVLVPEDPQPVKTGTLSSLAPLLESRPDLNPLVMGDNVRLDAAGIEGARVFWVEGRGTWPVVTEDVKVALDEEGVSGVVYRLAS